MKTMRMTMIVRTNDYVGFWYKVNCMLFSFMFESQIKFVDYNFVLFVECDYVAAELSAFLHFTKAKHQQTLVGAFVFTKEGGGDEQFLLVCNLPSIYG